LWFSNIVVQGQPMFQQDDCRENAPVKRARRANKAYLLATAEYWLHFADQLDYLIRRWVIPVRYGVTRSTAATPFFRWSFPRKHSRGETRSTSHREALVRGNGLLNEVQAAFGQCLSAEYDLTQPIPDRLIDLLRQFEQQNGKAQSDGYPIMT
jgi:hypothetical protein